MGFIIIPYIKAIFIVYIYYILLLEIFIFPQSMYMCLVLHVIQNRVNPFLKIP